MMTVFLEEIPLGGKVYLYQVMVDYRKKDEFMSRTGSLTWAQQDDVARGYREALDGYVPPSVVSTS